ncbi:MAG: response regulator [Acidobacteria bacterium]|nr:response regulator [Acidobacteriota bacterium]
MARRELCDLLASQGFQMVAEVTDNRNAIRLIKQFNPDVAILDAASEFVAGLKAAREILLWNQKAKIILLSLHAEGQYALAALQAGVRGYVLKGRAVADLGQAICKVSKGGIYLSSGVSFSLVEAYLPGNE